MAKNKLLRILPSLRLRTLPLSVSGVMLGAALAKEDFEILTFLLIILTALSLQLLGNLANEIGDVQNGADGEQRVGPRYGLQSGLVSAAELRGAMRFFLALSAAFGLAMILWAFRRNVASAATLAFLVLGAAAIVAALKYTMGKNAYGYKGFGDLFVLIFFGWATVFGTYFLLSGAISWRAVFASTAVGLLAVAALNVNNLRDMAGDFSCGKRTLAVRFGERFGRIYHAFVVATALVLLGFAGFWEISLATSPLFFWHVWAVFSRSGRALDGQLPAVSVLTFLTVWACCIFEIFI